MQLMRLSHGAGPVHPATLPLGTLEEAVYKRQIYKQQQSNMVMDGVQEPRYWEGVQVRQMVPAPHLHQLEASVFGSRAGCCMLQHSQLVPDENWQQAAHPGRLTCQHKNPGFADIVGQAAQLLACSFADIVGHSIVVRDATQEVKLVTCCRHHQTLPLC
jgi:hypothetical protein